MGRGRDDDGTFRRANPVADEPGHRIDDEAVVLVELDEMGPGLPRSRERCRGLIPHDGSCMRSSARVNPFWPGYAVRPPRCAESGQRGRLGELPTIGDASERPRTGRVDETALRV